MRQWVLVSALLLVVVATSSETALSSTDAPFSTRSTDVLVQLDETAAGAKEWRVRSLVKVPLEGWVMSKIQWFESQDGTGEAADGEPMASSFRGRADIPPNNEFGIENAVDGSYETVWESEDGEPGQWFGIKFPEKKDIKSMVIRIPDLVKGPASVMVEKSEDGETFSRVAEISDMLNWGVKDQLFKFVPMDILPSSVFSIRSQKDPAYCIGVRTRKEFPEDEDSALIHIEEGAKLELQKCLDDTVTQWWSFDIERGLLHNAADAVWIAHVQGDLAASHFEIKKCLEGCPDATKDEFMYSDSVRGGFLRKKNGRSNIVISVKNDAIEEGNLVTLGECGTDPEVAAELNNCPENKASQWELLPMFAVEAHTQAVKCSPYSHNLQEPQPAAAQQDAQRLCAADNECSAYNWADNSVEDYPDRVYLCHKLHDVHPNADGWELGIRAGRAYDSPYEKRAALLDTAESFSE
jgi:hypothetical protein